MRARTPIILLTLLAAAAGDVPARAQLLPPGSPDAASSARNSGSVTPARETRMPGFTPSFSMRLFVDTRQESFLMTDPCNRRNPRGAHAVRPYDFLRITHFK